MSEQLSILMAQINPTVGAITLNRDKILNIIASHEAKHDIIVFPELALTGYPPEDLLFRHELYSQVEAALAYIQAQVKDCYVILGHPVLDSGHRYNSASILHRGQCLQHYHKQHLPNYGVFDEKRYFAAGSKNPCIVTIKNTRVGLCICEDLWFPGPVEDLIAAQCQMMLCLNASPFEAKKYEQRENLLRHYAQQGLHILYVNQTGGQDELLFDGQSFAMDKRGNVCARAAAFREALSTVCIKDDELRGDITTLLSEDALVYQGLMCALSDYVNKNHFPGILVGLSGGVDSALTLALATDALGSERIHAVMMPSRYTAEMSSTDALKQLQVSGVQHTTLSIEPAYSALLETLASSFQGLKTDVTEENLQARVRGILLMALSNKTGNMLVSTSNKSETAVGYTILYGDMCGGFALLKDVLKTQVYRLAQYRNGLSPVIPERVLTRPPSAELAFDQTDQDSLPNYTTLDRILTYSMEDGLTADDIIHHGIAAETVYQVLNLVQRNEYKRRQAPVGPKISPCAFGRDWRYPITSGMRIKKS